jgi:fluoride ion exporter CrcB/FEX
VKKLFAVAVGGTLGSLVRYLVTELFPNYAIAIFIANLTGVAVAGLIAFRLMNSEISKLFWIPGFAGGLTTFSSVTLILAETNTLKAITYFYGTVVVSLALLYFIKPRARI